MQSLSGTSQSLGAARKSLMLLHRNKLTRRGRKLVFDEHRTVVAMPKDVPERTWWQILQKEEVDLLCFEIREQILDDALAIVVEEYMRRQTALFTVHCAMEAYTKLINWFTFLHDPGEDSTAAPLCYIPKRDESWVHITVQPSSKRDTWAKLKPSGEAATPKTPKPRHWEQCTEEPVVCPEIPPIPRVYWFPGRVVLSRDVYEDTYMQYNPWSAMKRASGVAGADGGSADAEAGSALSTADSEQVLTVTDYADNDKSAQVHLSGALHGAGDSSVDLADRNYRQRRATKTVSRLRTTPSNRLPSLQRSAVTLMEPADQKRRPLNLDFTYQVHSERLESLRACVPSRMNITLAKKK